MGINLEILSVTKGNISGEQNESENSDFGFCLLACLIVRPIVSNVSVWNIFFYFLSFFYCFDLIFDEFEEPSKYASNANKIVNDSRL